MFDTNRPHAARSPIPQVILVCSLAVWLMACSEARGSDASNADAVPLLELQEAMRVGSLDDPEVGFAAIGGVDVDRDGNLYVFEIQARHIRVYGPDGALLRAIGRSGQGPGEFRSSPRFGVVGDTVWTFEAFPRLLTLFDREGTVLHTARIEGLTVPLQGTMNGVALPSAMRSDGHFVSDVTLFIASRGGPSAASNDTVSVPRLLFDMDGTVVDTLGFSPRLPPDRPELERIEIGSQRYFVPGPPTDALIEVTLAEGRITVTRETPRTADAATFTVTRHEFSGDTVFHREYSYSPQPYGEAALDTFAVRSLTGLGGMVAMVDGVALRPEAPGDPEAARGVIRSRMSFPAFQPPIQAQFAGADGSLWLRREEQGEATYDWLIIDPAGDLQGVVRIPRRVRPAWAGGDEAWLIEFDEFDVPWMVKYRIGAR